MIGVFTRERRVDDMVHRDMERKATRRETGIAATGYRRSKTVRSHRTPGERHGMEFSLRASDRNQSFNILILDL